MAKNIIPPEYGMHPTDPNLFGLYIMDYDSFVRGHKYALEDLMRNYPFLTVNDTRTPFNYAYGRYAYGLSHGFYTQSSDILEDLIAHAMLAFVSACQDYDSSKGEFYQCFKGKWFSEVKKILPVKMQHEVPFDELVEAWIEHGDGGIYRELLVVDTIQEFEESLNIQETVEAAIADVEQRERVRKVLYLMYNLELTEKKIAEYLDVSLSTIKRDMKKLKEIYHDLYTARYGGAN